MRTEKKTDSVTVRLTREEKQRIARLAAELDLTRSEFCRRTFAGDFGPGGDDISTSGKRRRGKQKRRG